MQSTLTIQDLSASHELDGKAMTAVLGGEGNQANGTGQANAQNMAAFANVGNASLFGGPATIQSDNTFTQSASNHSYAENYKGLSIDLGPAWGGAIPT
jgi:hypothetical protein